MHRLATVNRQPPPARMRRSFRPYLETLEDRTVEFSNHQLSQSIATTTTGQPSPPATLQRREGKTAPDTAIVRVSVYRPGGGTVAGSGQHFLVLFPR